MDRLNLGKNDLINQLSNHDNVNNKEILAKILMNHVPLSSFFKPMSKDSKESKNKKLLCHMENS